MSQLSVVSDGTSQNSRVYLPDGSVLDGVVALEWILDDDALPKLRLTLIGVQAEIKYDPVAVSERAFQEV